MWVSPESSATLALPDYGRVARDTSEIWAVGTMRVIAWFRQLFRLLSQPGFFVVNYFRFARDMGTIAKARG